jgi:hypothetical protein
MASIGTTSMEGMVDLKVGDPNSEHGEYRIGATHGRAAWLMWRGAYWVGKGILSWQNMLLLPMYWLKTFVFGRDISRF